MKNFIIPYKERSTSIGRYPSNRKLMLVDNIGLMVNYDGDETPSIDIIRRHLICLQEKRMYIQASTVNIALNIFANKKASKIGVKYKAYEISATEHNPVIEYESCEYIRLNSFICCARYDELDQKGTMSCILDGLDWELAPHDCPIHKQMDSEEFQLKQIGGIWIKTFNKLEN